MTSWSLSDSTLTDTSTVISYCGPDSTRANNRPRTHPSTYQQGTLSPRRQEHEKSEKREGIVEFAVSQPARKRRQHSRLTELLHLPK